VILDVKDLCSYTDSLIICHGRSTRQVQAIADHLELQIKHDRGLLPIGIEGMVEGKWVLVDYGSVVIHVFYEPIRDYYNLEGIWPDAKQIAVDFE